MKVEILSPPEDSFVVGRDLVGFAKVGSEPDVWEDLLEDAGAFTAQRGGTTSKVNALDVGTLSCPVKDADPEVDFRFRVGRHVRLYDPDREKVLWYGRIYDLPATDEGGYTVTTFAASDVVDSLANTTRYGAGVPGEVETLRSRITRLGTSATVPLRYVETSSSVEGLAVGSANNQDVATVPGHRYRIDFTFTWTMGGFLLGRVGRITVTPSGAFVNLEPGETGGTLEFTAESDVSTLSLTRGPFTGSPPTIDIHDLTVTHIEGPAVLQAVTREGTLSEHLDMACNSVGAVWRPTLDGAVEVLEGVLDENPAARFTDDPHDPDTDTSFTKIDMGYGATEDLINDLSVTNYGPSADTTRGYTNPASIQSNGRRSSTLETCLATEALVDARAAQLLLASSTPRWAPRSLTFVYEHLEDVPELYSFVLVTRRDVVHLCQVLGVSHEVEPYKDHPTGRKHLVTLTLRKVS